jgi:hypothetical protein
MKNITRVFCLFVTFAGIACAWIIQAQQSAMRLYISGLYEVPLATWQHLSIRVWWWPLGFSFFGLCGLGLTVRSNSKTQAVERLLLAASLLAFLLMTAHSIGTVAAIGTMSWLTPTP